MKIYYTKATYAGTTYKLDEFFVGTDFKQDINKMQDMDIKTNDGLTSLIVANKLPDNTDVRDYTHIIVPEENKVYRISGSEWVNKKQVKILLVEDALLSNYQDLKSSSLLLSRTNSTALFNGVHDVRDIAIEHSCNPINTIVKDGTPEILVAYTFQNDAEPVFTLKDLDNFPEVDGTFSTINELRSAYPDVNTYVPTSVDYFLKFKRLTNGVLYQAVFIESSVEWVKVKDKLIVFNGRTGTTNYDKKFNKTNKYGYVRTQIGDIGTKTYLFTIDASIYQRVNFIGKFGTASPQTMHDNLWQLPNYYSIESFTDSDKLLNVKLISTSMINIDLSLSEEPVTASMNTGTGGVANWQTVMSNDNYLVKTIGNTSISIEVDNNVYATNDQGQAFLPPSMSLSIINFKENIYIYKPINGNPTVFDYEPFKKYFLFVYGEMVEIPAKYAFSTLNLRIAFTSQEMLFEIYTTTHNVIASGRLNLNMRWSVDKLDQFYAQNPTYKEQFWVNNITRAISAGGGAGVAAGIGSNAFTKTGAYNMLTRNMDDFTRADAISNGSLGSSITTLGRGMSAGIGIVAGAGTAAISLGTAAINNMFMEKGLRDQADAIFGVNDIAMTWLKGFGLYWVVVTPDTLSNSLMLDNYAMTGFPTAKLTTIDSLPVTANTVFGPCKLVQGQLLRTVKNNYATAAINDILLKGVILI